MFSTPEEPPSRLQSPAKGIRASGLRPLPVVGADALPGAPMPSTALWPAILICVSRILGSVEEERRRLLRVNVCCVGSCTACPNEVGFSRRSRGFNHDFVGAGKLLPREGQEGGCTRCLVLVSLSNSSHRKTPESQLEAKRWQSRAVIC